MISHRLIGSTLACEVCKGVQSAALALSTTIHPEGWFIERLMDKKEGRIRQVNICPKCKVLVREALAKKEQKNE